MNTLRDKLSQMKDDITLKYDKSDQLKRDLEQKKKIWKEIKKV